MRVWVERRVEITDEKLTTVVYEFLLGRDVEIPDILFLKPFEVKIGLSFYWINPEHCFYDVLEHRMLCRLEEVKICKDEWESTQEMYEKSGFEVMNTEEDI